MLSVGLRLCVILPKRKKFFMQPQGFSVCNWRPRPYPERCVMEGRFCQVEPLNLHVHCRSLYEANNHSIDDKLWTYLPYGPFSSYEDYMAWIEWAEQSRDRSSLLRHRG